MINIKRPWLAGGLAAAAVSLFIIISIISALPQRSASLFSFLPAQTTFFYSWHKSDKTIFDWLATQQIISNQTLQTPDNFVRKLLPNGYDKVEAGLWLQTDGQNGQVQIFLLDINEELKPLLKRLQNEEPQYYYRDLGKGILAISDQAEQLADLSKQSSHSLAKAHYNDGLNIYWRVDRRGEQLDPLASWLAAVLDGPEFLLNLREQGAKKIIQLSQPNTLSADTLAVRANYDKLGLPTDADRILAYGSSLSDDTSLVSQQFVKPIFQNLPYQNLFEQNISWLTDGLIIMEKDQNWLLAGPQDWHSLLPDLASELSLVESKRVLADGTAYIELLASPEANVLEHDYKEQKYWQFDSLFGWQLDQAYYLTNSQTWLEDFISKNSSILSLWPDCFIENTANPDRDTSSIGASISDFIILNTVKLPDGDIKTYLQAKNIGFLGIFTWLDKEKKHWSLCFE